MILKVKNSDYKIISYSPKEKKYKLKKSSGEEIYVYFRYNSWRIKQVNYVWTKEFIKKHAFNLDSMLKEYKSKGGELIDGFILNKSVKGICKKKINWKKSSY